MFNCGELFSRQLGKRRNPHMTHSVLQLAAAQHTQYYYYHSYLYHILPQFPLFTYGRVVRTRGFLSFPIGPSYNLTTGQVIHTNRQLVIIIFIINARAALSRIRFFSSHFCPTASSYHPPLRTSGGFLFFCVNPHSTTVAVNCCVLSLSLCVFFLSSAFNGVVVVGVTIPSHC